MKKPRQFWTLRQIYNVKNFILIRDLKKTVCSANNLVVCDGNEPLYFISKQRAEDYGRKLNIKVIPFEIEIN